MLVSNGPNWNRIASVIPHFAAAMLGTSANFSLKNDVALVADTCIHMRLSMTVVYTWFVNFPPLVKYSRLLSNAMVRSLTICNSPTFISLLVQLTHTSGKLMLAKLKNNRFSVEYYEE